MRLFQPLQQLFRAFDPPNLTLAYETHLATLFRDDKNRYIATLSQTQCCSVPGAKLSRNIRSPGQWEKSSRAGNAVRFNDDCSVVKAGIFEKDRFQHFSRNQRIQSNAPVSNLIAEGSARGDNH